MNTRLGKVALECLSDLGITIIYAGHAGLLVTAIVASDAAPTSVLRTALYPLLLPAGAVALICFEVAMRATKERRDRSPRKGDRAQIAIR